MQPASCPSDADLNAYAVGALDGDSWDAVAAHTTACESCLTRLADLTPADPLLMVLRRPAEATPPDPAFARVVAGLLGETARDRLPSGSLVREYRILEPLGEGGMGAVYKARHERLDKLVALKVMRCARGAEALARFAREMKAAGRLRHPHVVAATDAGEESGQPFLVMEYVEGCDLAKLVRQRGPLRPADACEAVRQAALGLAHAHAAGLVHRDVKPSNLMLAADGTVKVLDLGLAVWNDGRLDGNGTVATDPPTDPGADDLTQPSRAVGTRGYMAPEQVRDAHAVDARADVYGLGVTLVFLLTGQPPTSGTAVPGVPGAVLRRLLADAADERFAGADDVARALGRLAGGSDLQALAAGRAPRRHRGRLWWLSAAVVAVCAAARWATPPGDQQSPPVGQVAVEQAAPAAPLPPPRQPPPPGIMPLSAEKASELRARWAEYLDRPAVVEVPGRHRYVLIPPGELTVSPSFTAVLPRPYEMGACEVTVAQYRAFVDATHHRTEGEANGRGSLLLTLDGPRRKGVRGPQYRWDSPGFPEPSDALPVTHVGWHDAVAYCDWLTQCEGRRCRLPTLAEWRWALQAGAFAANENLDVAATMVAAYDLKAPPAQPKPVGSLKPNVWGLHDLFGNVEEWTGEFYNPTAPAGPSGRVNDPKGPPVAAQAWAIGGGYVHWPINQTSRTYYSVRYSNSALGFRVVREIDVPPIRAGAGPESK